MNLQGFRFRDKLLVRRFGSVSIGAKRNEWAIWDDWRF